MISITIIHAEDPAWADVLQEWFPLLGAPKNETLLPVHFMQIVFPKLGGKMALIFQAGEPLAVAFLFPRKVSAAPASMGGIAPASSQLYTMRLNPVVGQEIRNPRGLWEEVNNALAKDEDSAGGKAILYEIGIRNSYRASAQPIGTLDELPLTIGQPSEEEAKIVRSMHQQIWQNEEGSLYPVDIHCREFGLATDLVARVGEEVAGFLIGFYKAGGSPLPEDWWERFRGEWRIESQVMGVPPQFRGQQLGYFLKRAQGELALRTGVQLINWTADPLQFPNAVLNFGKLGAIAFDFYADLYPFRNELNRVPASRFGLTWLIGTERVRSRPLDFRHPVIIDIGTERIAKVNDGWQQSLGPTNEARIAIEIPADWNAIQRDDIESAVQWRSALDAIFEQYIGIDTGKFTVTGVGKEDDRCYLIAERSDEALWSRLQ